MKETYLHLPVPDLLVVGGERLLADLLLSPELRLPHSVPLQVHLCHRLPDPRHTRNVQNRIPSLFGAEGFIQPNIKKINKMHVFRWTK
jgi:hypothetical protein